MKGGYTMNRNAKNSPVNSRREAGGNDRSGEAGLDTDIEAYVRKKQVELEDQKPLTWNCSKSASTGGLGRICKSFRCFRCRTFVIKRDAWRVEQAVLRTPGRWFFMVLTLASWKHHKPIRENYKQWTEDFERLFRKFKREQIGMDAKYICVIEQHTSSVSSGQPHANILLTSSTLTAADASQIRKIRRFLKDQCPSFSFGYSLHFEEVNLSATSSIAGYVAGQKRTKSAATAIGAEVVKTSQLPVLAPKKTRRIRASLHLLPSAAEYLAAVFPLQNDSEEQKQRYMDTMRCRIETFRLHEQLKESKDVDDHK
jgi:hypothetical protein